MKECYVEKNFKPDTLAIIAIINEVIDDYQDQGFRLTVRQLYYQLVARAIIPNTLQEYKRVASIINDGKLAGVIDWEAIEDRTREFVRQQRWNSGEQILRAAHDSFHMDMWDKQEYRLFVIVEKEALVGVLEPTCRQYDVPLLAARGYPSGTVLREFVESDVSEAINYGQRPIILHLGDHDPSGLDMSRDLRERIELFAREPVELERLALNMDQIRELRPPENPAKTTDARYAAYRRRYGDSSWELDALSPAYLANLVSSHIERYIDEGNWQNAKDEVEDIKRRIIKVSKDFA